MNPIHLLGFARIGDKRELKKLQEAYWEQSIDSDALLSGCRALRQRHWLQQKAAGVNRVAVGDFSLYDHVLDALLLVGAAPQRFALSGDAVSTEDYFTLARGSRSQTPLEMTKWFDSNYHYLVPEWSEGQTFKLSPSRLLEQLAEARALGLSPKPVLLGPLTLLWLGKAQQPGLDRLSLLPGLIAVYQQLLSQLAQHQVDWVQLDEPILALDLPEAWLNALDHTYQQLAHERAPKLLLATYFGSVAQHRQRLNALPIDGLHLDLARAPEQLADWQASWPKDRVLSAGIIDGRNVWRADLSTMLTPLEALQQQLGERLWLAPSCSLLHCPIDLAQEMSLDIELKTWMAFGLQKLNELKILQRGLQHGRGQIRFELEASDFAQQQRKNSSRIHQAPASAAQPLDCARHSPFAVRAVLQRERLQLPLLPTTTIGSFPQTASIRQARAAYRRQELSPADYQEIMRAEIRLAISRQEALGLDLLVHGEAERNDMVEYFGAQLQGFALSNNGWVQSYGSRCVKPPIIYGDVARIAPMTVDWATYAQSLTDKPVKGMLTGPVTILQWSFVRDDLPRSQVCRQIARALNAEVRDLEQAGLCAIQIDEPALREGLPLRRVDWDEYLSWAAAAFRLSCAEVSDTTQIHTHMCYAEFNDILPAIAALDADVITIETSRSRMEILTAFARFDYPNDIGPGVYDIHSPRLPPAAEIESLLRHALAVIPAQQLWVNPDCGLKTRSWTEVEAALSTMVAVASKLRQELTATGQSAAA
jgi:5-methyltetrahydropteroyltriglutamate--homocysteine methyltransferase